MNDTPREDLYLRFVLTFADLRRRIEPVTQADLDRLAATVGTTLPAAYARFLKAHGAVYCPSILQLTTRCGLDHPDLRRFLSPAEIVTASGRLASDYLPDNLVAFAADCLGNPFCFPKSQTPRDDAPVLFLPRQGDLVQLDEGFDVMLRWYVDQADAVASLMA